MNSDAHDQHRLNEPEFRAAALLLNVAVVKVVAGRWVASSLTVVGPNHWDRHHLEKKIDKYNKVMYML
jgi:hypothetical protein